ncbi:hypothetical protein J2T07_002736 [Luteibacter jiangsuensis]|uniref:Uncharacterized protein n=1 Tax=Luteibacter jiangsuensis TaxID=637577 RepID=A0ABT9SZW2_9GAMM|nr:hypothetical protein [Luteibacter jiangsuensis]MDQ0010546.1 hypothetical protein [Luteibacter jiangsuensis]
MTEFDPATQISDAMREEARQNPGGWVYVISGNFGPSDTVPPHAIVGAWKVDVAGEIIAGSFQKNPNFVAQPV